MHHNATQLEVVYLFNSLEVFATSQHGSLFSGLVDPVPVVVSAVPR